jgi:hypothetical protein
MDEAQNLDEDLMQTVLPLMSAQVDPQVWFFGTPPRKDNAWIYKVKEAGEGCTPGYAWFDYGIEYIDPTTPEFVQVVSDPATWKKTNPSWGVRRPNRTGFRQKAAEGELTKLGMTMAFAMERTGMWLPKARTAGDSSIAPEVWGRLIASKPEVPGDIAIAFHINARRTHGTIMWAGKIAGLWRVGIADHRPGVAWVMGRLAELKMKYGPIAFAVDARGEGTIRDLKEMGIKVSKDKDRPVRCDLIIPTMDDVASSFSTLVDAANAGTILHHNEPPLNAAVSVPARLFAGGATFDHKVGIEVGPSCGAALAMWAYLERVDKVVTDYDPLDFIR